MKTRKLAALLLAACMTISLGACGGGGDGSSGGGDGTIVFKVAHVDPESGPLQKNLLEFEKYVEEKTGGKVDVQVYANGILGGDREILEGINLGTIQMGNMASSNMCAYGDKFALYELPFLFKDFDSAVEAFDGELGDIYNEWMAEQDFACLGVFTYGFRGLSNSVRPVSAPADMKGIKVRVMEVPLYVDTFTAIGSNPTPMNFNEIYTGLQQGTIEGQDNSPEQTYLAKFYEVQKYYTTLNHVLSNGLAVCKKSYLKSLPEDCRQAIVDGMKICMDGQRQDSVEMEEEYLDKMEAEGMTIIRLTDEQRAQFREKVVPIYEQYREIVGDDVMDLALSYSK